jgi:hypothetical protein
VTIELEPVAGVIRLTATKDRLEGDAEMLEGISDGWPKVLASLKSLMEVGKARPKLWQKKAPAARSRGSPSRAAARRPAPHRWGRPRDPLVRSVLQPRRKPGVPSIQYRHGRDAQ